MRTEGTLIQVFLGEKQVLPAFRSDDVPAVGDLIHCSLKGHVLKKPLRVVSRHWIVDRPHYDIELALVLKCEESSDG